MSHRSSHILQSHTRGRVHVDAQMHRFLKACTDGTFTQLARNVSLSAELLCGQACHQYTYKVSSSDQCHHSSPEMGAGEDLHDSQILSRFHTRSHLPPPLCSGWACACRKRGDALAGPEHPGQCHPPHTTHLALSV